MVERLAWTLIHFVWEGAVVAAVLAILLWATRRGAASLRYGLACTALILLVACPFVTYLQLTPAGSVPTITGVVRHATSHFTAGETILPESPVFPLLVKVWALGVALLSVRFVGTLVHVERWKRRHTRPAGVEWQDRVDILARRMGMSRGIRVLVSDRINVPSAWGVFKAVVVLPTSMLAQLSPAQVETILLHELAHIRRHDYLVNLLQTVVETALFYHPATWWISAVVRREREHCCDDVVVSMADAMPYARALLQLEERRTMLPRPTLSAKGSNLMNRIARILGAKPAPIRISPLASTMTALGVLAAVMGGTLQAQAQVTKTKPAPIPPKITVRNVKAKTKLKKVRLAPAPAPVIRVKSIPIAKPAAPAHPAPAARIALPAKASKPAPAASPVKARIWKVKSLATSPSMVTVKGGDTVWLTGPQTTQIFGQAPVNGPATITLKETSPPAKVLFGNVSINAPASVAMVGQAKANDPTSVTLFSNVAKIESPTMIAVDPTNSFQSRVTITTKPSTFTKTAETTWNYPLAGFQTDPFFKGKAMTGFGKEIFTVKTPLAIQTKPYTTNLANGFQWNTVAKADAFQKVYGTTSKAGSINATGTLYNNLRSYAQFQGRNGLNARNFISSSGFAYLDAGDISLSGKGGRVDVDVKDAQLSPTLRRLAKIAKLSVVIAAGKYQDVSLVLSGVAPEKALEILCKAAGANFRVEGGVYYVTAK